MTNELRQAAERLKCTERLLDLVRYMRIELHDAGLITDDEYVALATMGPESVQRLQTYDHVKRDAARYRWLRERRILRDDIYVSLHHPPDMNGKAVDHPHGDELDAAIDTAMQKGAGQ